MDRVSWTAVAATLCMGGALAAVLVGWTDLAMILIGSAIVWAILSTKETT